MNRKYARVSVCNRAHSHIAFRIMTVESRFQSNTDVNANWIHKCDILSHMKYVGRNKLIGFSYISFNGTSFIYLFRVLTLFLLFFLILVVFATCHTYKRHTHTHTLTRAWIFSERGTYWCVLHTHTHHTTHVMYVELVHKIENEPITHALLCSFHLDFLPYSVS